MKKYITGLFIALTVIGATAPIAASSSQFQKCCSYPECEGCHPRENNSNKR